LATTAAACPDRLDALTTSRVITVDPAQTQRVGRKHFPASLPLSDKEVVLTFDDGPWPGTTERILDALKRECVHATFFLLGRNAAKYPALVRRELAEGHTVGHHTFSHPLLTRRSLAAAEAEIERGISAVQTAAGNESANRVARTFFRFPGFASSAPLLERVAARGFIVFGADLWASDWNPMTPQGEMQLVLSRLEQSRGGILLLHDTKAQTAAMLPSLLRQLKSRGFRIVHMVPATDRRTSGN
jgi:peptidoglycan/xylan/chitin deacetylase (PgdA/CDA1 family)